MSRPSDLDDLVAEDLVDRACRASRGTPCWRSGSAGCGRCRRAAVPSAFSLRCDSASSGSAVERLPDRVGVPAPDRGGRASGSVPRTGRRMSGRVDEGQALGGESKDRARFPAPVDHAPDAREPPAGRRRGPRWRPIRRAQLQSASPSNAGRHRAVRPCACGRRAAPSDRATAGAARRLQTRKPSMPDSPAASPLRRLLRAVCCVAALLVPALATCGNRIAPASRLPFAGRSRSTSSCSR